MENEITNKVKPKRNWWKITAITFGVIILLIILWNWLGVSSIYLRGYQQGITECNAFLQQLIEAGGQR